MNYYRQGPMRPGGGSTIQIGLPPVTPYLRAIMIACVSVFLAQQVYFAVAGSPLSLVFGLVPARVVHGWLFQPLTYMFLHGDLFHLLFNMLFLWMFGGELERHWGSRAFLRYYLVCGIGGGVAATAMGYLPSARPDIPTVGASGAIFGLLAAYGLLFGERVVLFMMIFPMKARTMALVLFAINLFYTVTQPGAGISHVAHVGGAVVGFAYLKRAWRIGDLYRELRWRIRRRRFKVMTRNSDDDWDRWVN